MSELKAGWQIGCPQCTASKFPCDQHAPSTPPAVDVAEGRRLRKSMLERQEAANASGDNPNPDAFFEARDEWHEWLFANAEDLLTAAEQVAGLRKENDAMRGIIAKSDLDCVYCGLPAARMNECADGFPGCGRADDVIALGAAP